MANILTYLNKIKTALYGKEVRNSIHDGIKAINTEVENTTEKQRVLKNDFDTLKVTAGNSLGDLNNAITGGNNLKNELNTWLNDNRDIKEMNGRVRNNTNEIKGIKDSTISNKAIVITDDSPIGSIIWFTGKELSRVDSNSWRVCNGQVLNKTDYLELWEAIGSNENYGNDGGDTFKLPNLIENKKSIQSVDLEYNTGEVSPMDGNYSNLVVSSDNKNSYKTMSLVPYIKINNFAKDKAELVEEIENLHEKVEGNSTEINNMKDAIIQNRPIIISDDTPVGTVIWWSAKDVNNNIDTDIWKLCNGQTLNKDDYLELWNIIGANENYSANNGGTTFKLPDLINTQRFIRSVGINYNVGALEDDDIKRHDHHLVSHSGKRIYNAPNHLAFGDDYSVDTFICSEVKANKVPQGDIWQYSSYTGSFGGAETRPKNIAFIPLIKCKQRAKDMATVAQEWTNFKENGGEINGNFKLNEGALTAKGIANTDSELGLTSKNKRIWFGELGETDGETAFRPQQSDRGTINLGWAGFEFKDLWLGGFNRSSTGYSKLPNGLIIQWGALPTSFVDGYVNFPIVFPKSVLHVWTDIECASDTWAGNIYQQRVDNTKFRMVHVNKHPNKPGNPIWFAIGL